MGKIYQRASRAMICLGESTPESERTFNYLSHVAAIIDRGLVDSGVSDSGPSNSAHSLAAQWLAGSPTAGLPEWMRTQIDV